MANDSRGLGSASQDVRDRVAKAGGNARKAQGADYSTMGHNGGQAAQESGHAHKLTETERSKGGSHSGGNFKNNPARARETGKLGDRR